MLQHQRDIVAVALGAMRLDVGNQLGDADIWVSFLEKSQGKVEANPIDLKGVQPIDANVSNKLFDTAIVVVELLKESASCESADLRRISRIHVKPEIRKPVIGIDPCPHVIEDAVHDDVHVPRMQLVYQPLQPEKFVGWLA